MKAILMSIQPKWCEKIVNGEKTIEVRKTRPKLETPFKVYIYCTKGKEVLVTNKLVSWTKEVIGEFVCDMIEEFQIKGALGVRFKRFTALYETCLKVKEMRDYAGNSPILYGWHISELKIYDKPKELGEFYKSLPKKVLEEGDYDCRKDWDVLCADAPEGSEYCAECIYGGRVQITRPQQSWCYVEELEG